MKILIEIEATGKAIDEIIKDVEAYCRIKNAMPNFINTTELKNFKIKDVSCDHPDHNDTETCEDRAIGCSSYCKCCMGSIAKSI